MIRLDFTRSASWLDESHGIQSNAFFKDQYTCSLSQRIKNILLSSFRECAYMVKAGIKNSFFSQTTSYFHLSPQPDRDALVVFFHGLNGRPTMWNSHIAQYEEHNKNGAKIDLFAPTLPKFGHCAVDDDRVEALYDSVKVWIQKNPGKPLVLFAQSYGSRFAATLEHRLRKEYPQTPVYVSLTGAVLYGTSLVTKVSDLVRPSLIKKMTFGLLTKTTSEELRLGSQPSQDILYHVQSSFDKEVAERRYRMYASPYDTHVKEFGSSLPKLSKHTQINEKHYFVPDYGHSSLIDSFLEEKIGKTVHWIQKHTTENFSEESCVHCLKKKNVVAQQGILGKAVDCVRGIFKCIATFFEKLSAKLCSLTKSSPALNEEKIENSSKTTDNQNIVSSQEAELQPLTVDQQRYANQLQQCTIRIVQGVLLFFTNPRIRSMSPQELKEVLEVANETQPDNIDERTQKFLDQMMIPINEMINALDKLSEALENLAQTSQDPDLRTKLVRGIAFPFIQNLMRELDQESPRIVDQLSGYEFHS